MSIKSRHKWYILLVIIVAIALKGYSYYYPKTTIVIGAKILTVQVANTPARQFKGLSGRKDLGKYDGMLFKFSTSARHTFVMRDMNFAIDIIWIDDGKIVDIKPNVQLEKNKTESQLTQYTPLFPANMVLEVPAGFTEKNGIKVGDSITILE